MYGALFHYQWLHLIGKLFKIFQIDSVDFEGQNRRSILDSSIQQAQPQGLDFYNNFIYYVDAAYEQVMQGKVESSGSSKFEIFKKDVKDLVNIKIFKSRPGASKLSLFLSC